MCYQRIITLLFLIVSCTVFVHSQVEVVWERSEAMGNKPLWFGTDSERGMGYGVVGGNERMYVARRGTGVDIRIINALTGDDAGTLYMTEVSGGWFPINDVDVSADGVIFACNLALDASSDPFKVYMWHSEDDQPEEIISFNNAPYRLGDKITVTGSLDDNTLTIYAAASYASPDPGDSKNILRFTTGDHGFTFDVENIELGGVDRTGIHPSVGPTAPGQAPFYFNASAGPFDTEQNPTLFEPDGTQVGVLPGDFTNTNSIRYYELNNRKYIATFRSTGEEDYAVLFDVTDGPEQGDSIAVTPSLGSVENTFESGDVAFRPDEEDKITLYVLASNNGIGAYSLEFAVPNVQNGVTQDYPEDYQLYQNYPNPFNPETTIMYSLPRTGMVTLRVYNILGQKLDTLVNEIRNAGTYTVTFDASNLSSGLYMYRLQADDYTEMKYMLHQK